MLQIVLCVSLLSINMIYDMFSVVVANLIHQLHWACHVQLEYTVIFVDGNGCSKNTTQTQKYLNKKQVCIHIAKKKIIMWNRSVNLNVTTHTNDWSKSYVCFVLHLYRYFHTHNLSMNYNIISIITNINSTHLIKYQTIICARQWTPILLKLQNHRKYLYVKIFSLILRR